MYKFTRSLASFRPDPAGEILFRAIEGDQPRIDELLGVITAAAGLTLPVGHEDDQVVTFSRSTQARSRRPIVTS